MKLYCLPQSPYARKAMILNRLGGLGVEEIEVTRDIVNGYAADVNPVGKIPALVRDGHDVMMGSPVICQYLDSLKTGLLPVSGEDRWSQMRLHALGDALSDAVYQYRFETMRDQSLHWADIIQRHKNGINKIVEALEAEAASLGAPWDYGNLAIVCALDYMGWRAPHVDLKVQAPKLSVWHDGFKSERVWQDTFIYDRL